MLAKSPSLLIAVGKYKLIVLDENLSEDDLPT